MRLNRVSYFLDFYLAAFAMLVVAHRTAASGAGALPAFLLAAAGGYASWTLLEYLVHRFVYHRVRWFRRLHDSHHAHPQELFGGPPVVTVALILTIAFVALFGRPEGLAEGAAFGMLAGYMAYMAVHHAAHHRIMRPGGLPDRICRHHLRHHFDTEERFFGISTSFWDRILGTGTN
jgi:sterol desaturase/sphingolipid hydroxylase (fatty acid hydroxylase superfamily)